MTFFKPTSVLRTLTVVRPFVACVNQQFSADMYYPETTSPNKSEKLYNKSGKQSDRKINKKRLILDEGFRGSSAGRTVVQVGSSSGQSMVPDYRASSTSLDGGSSNSSSIANNHHPAASSIIGGPETF